MAVSAYVNEQGDAVIFGNIWSQLQNYANYGSFLYTPFLIPGILPLLL